MRATRLSPLWLLAAAILFAGCNETETIATAPDGSPLVFTGTVNFRSFSEHDFEMAEDGILSVTLSQVRVLLFDATQGVPTNIVLGFGLGQRNPTDGSCALTTNILIEKNQLQVYRLSQDSYCLRMFDPGRLPEDAVIGYELQGEITR